MSGAIIAIVVAAVVLGIVLGIAATMFLFGATFWDLWG